MCTKKIVFNVYWTYMYSMTQQLHILIRTVMCKCSVNGIFLNVYRKTVMASTGPIINVYQQYVLCMKYDMFIECNIIKQEE